MPHKMNVPLTHSPKATANAYMLPGLVNNIQHCEAVCEHMVTMMLHQPDLHARTMQIQFLRDCADICALTAKYLSRQSSFTRSLIQKCAEICEACGRECSRFQDEMSQHGTRVCFHCAAACREFLRKMS
ncbi:four-helix bundle copper-binding protein [Ammoniphilus sp. 3BR4]|uniref:four-helix bundle copper-binding protein n=1 Tax=Ammoniphilus sp. 3BR4 TaxID=3158265 RepID=UPI0034664064